MSKSGSLGRAGQFFSIKGCTLGLSVLEVFFVLSGVVALGQNEFESPLRKATTYYVDMYRGTTTISFVVYLSFTFKVSWEIGHNNVSLLFNPFADDATKCVSSISHLEDPRG